jgi:hypothetical protein
MGIKGGRCENSRAATAVKPSPRFMETGVLDECPVCLNERTAPPPPGLTLSTVLSPTARRQWVKRLTRDFMRLGLSELEAGKKAERVKLRRLWTIAVWTWAILLLLGMSLWAFAAWSSYIKHEVNPSAEPSRLRGPEHLGSAESPSSSASAKCGSRVSDPNAAIARFVEKLFVENPLC